MPLFTDTLRQIQRTTVSSKPNFVEGASDSYQIFLKNTLQGLLLHPLSITGGAGTSCTAKGYVLRYLEPSIPYLFINIASYWVRESKKDKNLVTAHRQLVSRWENQAGFQDIIREPFQAISIIKGVWFWLSKNSGLEEYFNQEKMLKGRSSNI